MLIFFQTKVSFNVFYEVDQNHAYQNQELQRLWLVIILVAIILIVKLVFRALIPDKPKWVMDEEERQKAQKELFKSGEEIQNSLSKVENEHNEERNKKEMKLKKKIQVLQKELVSANSKNQRPKEQSVHALPAISQWQISNPQEFKAKTLSQFYKTFKFMEHELLIQRIDDITKYEGKTLFLCNECHKSKAVLECLDCQEPFCKRCYKDVHLTAHAMVFGNETPPNITYFASENDQTDNVLKENDNVLLGRNTKNPKEKFKKYLFF